MFHHPTQRFAHYINSHLIQEHNLSPSSWCAFNTFIAKAYLYLYALAKSRNIFFKS